MAERENKVHAGFRLRKQNIEMIKEFENNLGINKTNVVDMILTLVGKDKEHFLKLIRKAVVE